MQVMWRKTPLPHRVWQRKTCKNQNTTHFTNNLVENLKRKPSHKERKQTAHNTMQLAGLWM
jgi:hypothetical protein